MDDCSVGISWDKQMEVEITYGASWISSDFYRR